MVLFMKYDVFMSSIYCMYGVVEYVYVVIKGDSSSNHTIKA